MSAPSQHAERIRLAKAMDIKWVYTDKPDPGMSWEDHILISFNPFTDANDDYRVLEWINSWPEELPPNDLYEPMCSYKIGDYARAALEAIENGTV